MEIQLDWFIILHWRISCIDQSNSFNMGLDKRVTYRRKNGFRTESNRVKMVRTPGGRLVYHYKKKKVDPTINPEHLGGKQLQGLKRLTAAEKSRAGKGAKRVNRPYGGVLSYDLVRERIIRAFLIEEQKIVKKVLKAKKK
jgi:large subunit ribosomal protein L34e